ncbi:hypothetical protein L208DRAFT_1360921 [Tricholoma matsutake]|nr:hypothetical protein L208DRAFT_1360921 [Tricholoma matsutake 945]
MFRTTNLGVQLIGTYINLILYTLESVQVYHYFRNSRRSKTDSKILKGAVILNLIMDSLATIAICALVYMYTVVFWGRRNAIVPSREYWPMVVVVVLTGTTTFLVQSFMVYRYWRICSHRILAGIIIVLMVASLVGTYLAAATTFAHLVPDREKGIPFIILGLGGAATTDVSLTALLVWQLYTSLRAGTCARETHSLIRRVSIMAIQTGLATSVVACTAFITFVVYPESHITDAVLYCVGRVYSGTMLFTLNTRGMISRDSHLLPDRTSEQLLN